MVLAFSFTTQTISKPIEQAQTTCLDKLKAADSDAPKLNGVYSQALPPGDQFSNLSGWVFDGKFNSVVGKLDTSKGVLDFSKGEIKEIPFTLTIPKNIAMPAKIAIFLHSLKRYRMDMLAIANTLASQNIASIAFDTIYHGDRSKCTINDHCESGGTCTIDTGICSNGFKKTDGVPNISGATFLSETNPFTGRDNFVQNLIDASALVRTIAKGGASGITNATISFDANNIYLVGLDLGAITAMQLLASEATLKKYQPNITLVRAVLNGVGAPLTDIIFNSPSFTETKQAILKANNNLSVDTVGYLQLQTVMQTILDRVDPGNFAAKIGNARAILQLGSKDDVIPPAFAQNLAQYMSVALDKTTFAEQKHGFLLKSDPEIKATQAAQSQMVQFLATGNVCTPNLTAGTCN